MEVTAASWAGVGWLGRVTARWGRARGSAETAPIHWGLATALVVEAKEREGFWQGSSLGLLLSLESN
jgi:hypothetical protein